METNLLRHCLLKHDDTFTSCWLNDDKRLKVGVKVTLKTSSNPNQWWEIVEISETKIDESLINLGKSEKFYDTNFDRTPDGWKSKAWTK